MQLTLCPAAIASIEAKDNRHQLTVLVDDIKNTIEKTKQFRGTMIQNIQEADGFLQASIRDVDGNSIILKEKL